MSLDDTTPAGSGGTSSHVGDSARRLAAILSADVKDYSRLMGADEEGTWYSILLAANAEGEAIAERAFSMRFSGGRLVLPGVMSRKKQVVPPLAAALM